MTFGRMSPTIERLAPVMGLDLRHRDIVREFLLFGELAIREGTAR